MSRPKKRSVSLAGHSTSLSVEEEFWDALKDIAQARERSVTRLLTEIDAERGDRNLSSAVRVFILNELQLGQDRAVPI